MRSGGKGVGAVRERNGWSPIFTMLSTEETYRSVVHLYRVSCQLLTQSGTGTVDTLHSRLQV